MLDAIASSPKHSIDTPQGSGSTELPLRYASRRITWDGRHR
jgi:hypothetical protein